MRSLDKSQEKLSNLREQTALLLQSIQGKPRQAKLTFRKDRRSMKEFSALRNRFDTEDDSNYSDMNVKPPQTICQRDFDYVS